MNIRPLHDRVVVKRIEEDETKDLARKVQALDDEGRDALLQAMLEDPDF